MLILWDFISQIMSILIHPINSSFDYDQKWELWKKKNLLKRSNNFIFFSFLNYYRTQLLFCNKNPSIKYARLCSSGHMRKELSIIQWFGLIFFCMTFLLMAHRTFDEIFMRISSIAYENVFLVEDIFFGLKKRKDSKHWRMHFLSRCI